MSVWAIGTIRDAAVGCKDAHCSWVLCGHARDMLMGERCFGSTQVQRMDIQDPQAMNPLTTVGRPFVGAEWQNEVGEDGVDNPQRGPWAIPKFGTAGLQYRFQVLSFLFIVPKPSK